MFPAVVTTNDRLRGERVDTMNQEEEKCWPQYKGGWVDDINNTTNIREEWCESNERNVIRVREMVSENRGSLSE